ncbi:MAG: Na/Pi symporter [Candidatus Sumerlaeaceae bacterium]
MVACLFFLASALGATTITKTFDRPTTPTDEKAISSLAKLGSDDETTAPRARQFQLTPVATLEVAVSARQVKFGTVGTTQTVRFLVEDEQGKPLAGVSLSPVVVAEPEGTRKHMEIHPRTAVTDAAGYVTFQVFLGDQPGLYDVLLFQNTPAQGEIVFTRLEFVVQDNNWATMLVLSLAGGLAIFLYGLKLASDGLQALVGDRLRQHVAEWTKNPLSGLLVGFVITTLTQSSGATTALVMTFVRAGALSLSNSIGIILGAAISGTLTVQLISLNLFAYALPAIAVGFAIYLRQGSARSRATGLAIMGVGFVFFGMKIMTDEMAPLKLFPFFTAAVKALSDHPVWAVAFSFLFTAMAQSSGATVGIVLSLTRQELLTLEEAIPMFFGAAIGASVTGLTAAIGAPPEAKRVALAHLLYKIAGTLVFLPFIGPLAKAGLLVTNLFMFDPRTALPADVNSRAVANTYTLFMIVTSALTIPAIPLLEKLCRFLVPEKRVADIARAKYLALTAGDQAAVKLGAARRELSRMARFVEEMYHKVPDALFEKDEEAAIFIRERDQKVDMLNTELTRHLIDLTSHDIGEKDILEATTLLFIVSDLESVGDIIDKNIVPLAQKMRAKNLTFSREGLEDLEALYSAVMERLSHTIIALTTKETFLANSVVEGFYRLQNEGKLLHYNHLMRLRANVLESVETSSIHLDVIHYLLRIDYLLFDICLHLLGKGLPPEVLAQAQQMCATPPQESDV